MSRPRVTVVVPFYGGPPEARRLAAALARLSLVEGDEVVVADNTPAQYAAQEIASSAVRVVPAVAERSSYHARNCGAEAATGEWLAFIDADTRPAENLLDVFFDPAPEPGCGAVAGAVLGEADQEGLVPRYTVARRWLDQSVYIRDGVPFGVTANLLVRRAAWASVGGFQEGIRSGGDYEFCRRLHETGWAIEWREHAVVEHRHRESVKALLRQAARYGASRAWQNRRYGTAFDPPQLRRRIWEGLRAIRGHLAAREREAAAFAALDIAQEAAMTAGYVSSNRPARAYVEAPGPRERRVAVMTDRFPELSETFVVNEVRALRRLGWSVRVDALRRPVRLVVDAQRELEPDFVEDDSLLVRLRDLAWLTATHPREVLADRRDRARWAAEEPVKPLRALSSAARRLASNGDAHLHVHFAGPAALDALRLARLVGVSWSVTAHAYDIYREPANLREKLEAATFATSGCEYTVRDLRRIAPAARVHVIVMGVDGDTFARRTPYPGGRSVLAVGRLVEKKGFEYLVEAAAVLRDRGVVDRVEIIGDGPLRPRLEARIAGLGLEDVVILAGARAPGEIRDALETADVLAMPCVVAADGDRDSMPVVVKEALAMEVPVVASDEVGLPEVVSPEWGRLVAPGDSGALGAALAEVLALPAQERAAMGRRGREHVLAHCSTDAEAGKLATLIGSAR